mmetsp:Transcript_37655/g.93493  ORF Transcript_37655/g.93493 Transcript_37655/m.93493 type:complete len:85 (+) Transcript_37655:158-412(+)
MMFTRTGLDKNSELVDLQFMLSFQALPRNDLLKFLLRVGFNLQGTLHYSSFLVNHNRAINKIRYRSSEAFKSRRRRPGGGTTSS